MWWHLWFVTDWEWRDVVFWVMFLSHTTTLPGPIMHFLGACEMWHHCIWKISRFAGSQLRDKMQFLIWKTVFIIIALFCDFVLPSVEKRTGQVPLAWCGWAVVGFQLNPNLINSQNWLRKFLEIIFWNESHSSLGVPSVLPSRNPLQGPP